MERVLVTGADGYIGRHVVAQLAKRNCEIMVSSLGLKQQDSPYRVIEHPIFDSADDHLYEHLGSPDRCIHLAWRDGFNHNSYAHIDDFPSHVHFVQALMDGGAKSVSVMGSMHEIGYWEGAIQPDTPAHPLSFYGIAKNSLRDASTLLAQKSGCNLKWLRAYYIVGDDASNHSIFTKIIESAQQGKKVFPFTSGKNKYDFLNVDELAQQIVAASLQDQVNGVINCCSGHPVSLGDQVESFIEQQGYDITLEYGAFPDRPYDSPGVWGDATAIRGILAADEQSEQ